VDVVRGGVAQRCSATNDRGGAWGRGRVAMVIEMSQVGVRSSVEASGTVSKPSPEGRCHWNLIFNSASHAEVCPLFGLVRTAQLSA